MKIRHHSSLRKGRRTINQQIYLITACCHDRQRWFTNVAAGRLVVDEIRQSDQSGTTHTIAFVVMPDHLHWLLQLRDGQYLSAVVGRVKGRSAYRIRRQFPCTGIVWQHAFHDRALRRFEDVNVAADYIVANPLRASLVTCISDYPLWYQENGISGILQDWPQAQP